MGALAALSAEDVERRWGDAGIRAWRLARADDLRRPVLARVETQPAVEVELASPSSTMEPVLFLVRAALDRLVQELIAHGRAAAAVAITLTLDDARGALVSEPVHTVTREVRPARPLARVAPLFERCRALLDRWTLTAPVSAVRVAIVAAAPLTGEQGDLLSASWRDIGAADAALERLRAELGPNAIVRAVHQDTHRPEKAGVWQDALDVEAVERRTRDVTPAVTRATSRRGQCDVARVPSDAHATTAPRDDGCAARAAGGARAGAATDDDGGTSCARAGGAGGGRVRRRGAARRDVARASDRRCRGRSDRSGCRATGGTTAIVATTGGARAWRGSSWCTSIARTTRGGCRGGWIECEGARMRGSAGCGDARDVRAPAGMGLRSHADARHAARFTMVPEGPWLYEVQDARYAVRGTHDRAQPERSG